MKTWFFVAVVVGGVFGVLFLFCLSVVFLFVVDLHGK